VTLRWLKKVLMHLSLGHGEEENVFFGSEKKKFFVFFVNWRAREKETADREFKQKL
jgi:hypothetical protein